LKHHGTLYQQQQRLQQLQPLLPCLHHYVALVNAREVSDVAVALVV
jgi:hypothetical protein